MCGITSGICFIALRDLDSSSRNIYPNGTTTLYDFSFMMEWASNSLCILEGFIFLCLLKMDYNDITETGKYNSFMWFCSGKNHSNICRTLLKRPYNENCSLKNRARCLFSEIMIIFQFLNHPWTILGVKNRIPLFPI